MATELYLSYLSAGGCRVKKHAPQGRFSRRGGGRYSKSHLSDIHLRRSPTKVYFVYFEFLEDFSTLSNFLPTGQSNMDT